MHDQKMKNETSLPKNAGPQLGGPDSTGSQIKDQAQKDKLF